MSHAKIANSCWQPSINVQSDDAPHESLDGIQDGSSTSGCATVLCRKPPNKGSGRIEFDANDCVIFGAMKGILQTAYCFGVFPLSGLISFKCVALAKWTQLAGNGKPQQPSTIIHFSLLSLPAMTALASLGVFSMIASISFSDLTVTLSGLSITSDANQVALKRFVFYADALMGTYELFNIAKQFPQLMKAWKHYEDSSTLFGTDWKQHQRRSFKIVSAAVMLSALVEHLLSHLTSGLVWPLLEGKGNGTTHLPDFKTYLSSKCANGGDDQLRRCLGFPGCVLQFIFTEIACFVWNFGDLFVMLISLGLVDQFGRFNRHVESMDAEKCSTEEWRELRKIHLELCTLVQKADEAITGLVLLSYLNNVFFICMQLLSGIETKSRSIIQRLYSVYSFAHLTGRAIAVSLLAAKMNNDSTAPIKQLQRCSTESYFQEVHRFQNQIVSTTVGLTGRGFFVITRSFILAIVGAIATYEIVLLQFSSQQTKN